MKATEQKEIRIILEMDQTEATWLLGWLQNKFPNEDTDCLEMRNKFFTELKASIPYYGVRGAESQIFIKEIEK